MTFVLSEVEAHCFDHSYAPFDKLRANGSGPFWTAPFWINEHDAKIFVSRFTSHFSLFRDGSMKERLLLFCLCIIFVGNVASQPLPLAPPIPNPDYRYKADILLVVAHPDDETAIGSYLAKAIYDDGKRAAIIYCTKGSGGGNSHGIEQSQAMAAIREIEARRGLAEFGIHNVWFVDGVDAPGQDVLHSLQNWGHGEVLEQVIRLVRLTRPEVIITWLPHYVAGENHGDHQASGVIATEAFDLAGDPTIFPAQVAMPRESEDINNFGEGLRPWQPKKIYYYSDASHEIKAPGPDFNMNEMSVSKNLRYYELAAKLHINYLTQGFVAESASHALETGDFNEFLTWLSNFNLIFGKAVVPCSENGDVFEGVAIEERTPFAAIRGYEPPKVKEEVTLQLGGVFAFYRDFWRAHEIENIASLVDPEMEVAAGSYVHIPLLLQNGTADSVDVTLTSTSPEGWTESSGSGRYRVYANSSYPVQTFFFAPDDVGGKGEIVWEARAQRKEIGKVTVKVLVKEWTLPQ
jgi:LmbE family N-acetylglucosaminyl deacetylase